MGKARVIKEIKSKVKEVKQEKEEYSDLEEELGYSENEQFSSFSGGGAFIPTLSNGQETVRSGPEINIPTAVVSEEEQISGRELYDTGRGLGDQRAAYVSNAVTSAGATLRSRNVGSDFSMGSSGSSLPEEQMVRGLARDSLDSAELGSEKYAASGPASQAAKKFKYEWE